MGRMEMEYESCKLYTLTHIRASAVLSHTHTHPTNQVKSHISACSTSRLLTQF